MSELTFGNAIGFLFIFFVIYKAIVGESPTESKSENNENLLLFPFKLIGWGLSIPLSMIFPFFRKEPATLEDAQFMGFWERRRVLSSKNKGLVIDAGTNSRLSLLDSFKNLILVSPTGGGKSAGFCIPNVLMLDQNMVLTDPSGEIFQKTSGFLSKNKGFDIKVLAPADLENSLRYNPLARAHTHSDLNRITHILITSAFGNDTQGDQTFWQNGSKTILNILLRAIKLQEPRYQNLANLRHLLNLFGADGSALDSLVSQLDEATFNEWKGFIAQDERVVQNFLSTAKSALEPFSDPDLCRLTGSDNLNFEAIRNNDKKTIIYLIIPESRFRYFGFLLSILFTQMFDYVLETKGAPVFFLMDEFANGIKIPAFSNLITVLRKRECSVSIILQDLEQLMIYGNSEGKIIRDAGVANKYFTSGLSSSTCLEIQKILGNTQIETERGTVTKPLLAASEARTMDGAIFVQANKAPIQVSMKPYFKIRALRKMSELPSYEIKVPQEEDEVAYLKLQAPVS